jgi:hypothetical protein
VPYPSRCEGNRQTRSITSSVSTYSGFLSHGATLTRHDLLTTQPNTSNGSHTLAGGRLHPRERCEANHDV